MNARRRPGLDRVEEEILGEKAATLGRAGERLEQALAEVTNLAAALDVATEPDARQRLAAEYEEARLRAARARLGLVIQREAVGLRNHRIVDQQCLSSKGVNVYPSEVEGVLLDVEELVPHHQLVVDRRGTLARVQVQVEPAAAFLGRAAWPPITRR